MQAKDVPDRPVLEFLARNPGWCFLWYGERDCERNTINAMPPETPYKVALAKMRQLEKRGLITGCTCGCRGDFEITEKGLALLSGSYSEGGTE